MSLDNGGPSLDTDPRMRFMRGHISDLLNALRSMPLDHRGFYMTALLVMYDRMGSLPSDDHEGARRISCDIRTYRRLKDLMLSLGKFVERDGRITNDRVEREIADYCREIRRRRDAALEREDRKRQTRVAGEIGRTSAEDRPEIAPKSAGSRPEVGATSGELRGDPNANLFQERNEINGCNATTVPEQDGELCSYARASTKPKPKQKEDIGGAPPPSPDGDHEVVPRLGKVDALQAFSAYNATALRCGLSQATVMTPAREKSILARLREVGMTGWLQALANIERSKYLRGGNKDGWRADLDFMIRPARFPKIFEGGWGNGAHGPVPTSDESRRAEAESAREFERAAAFDLGGEPC